MEKCQKCKKKTALISCSSCNSCFCFECDRLIHNLPKNKKHTRKNITSSFLNLDYIKSDLNNINIIKYKTPQNKNKENNYNKAKDKEDPNIRLINKLYNILNNDLDYNNENNEYLNNEKLFSEYKKDFNKNYKLIKLTKLNNNIDINKLLNIIEEQDIIINDLFNKINFLKNQIKNLFIDKKMINENTFEPNKISKDEKYFIKKLDIINKIYEKQKEELIKEQEKKISKIKMEYYIIKNKYLSIINKKEYKLKNNEEINEIIKKLKIDYNNINNNTNQLSKINDELNIAKFCMNEHMDELINKFDNCNNKVKINENVRNKKINNGKRFKSFNGKLKK